MPSLVHITTVPESFIFMRGQIAHMKRQGYRVHGISSPGPLLDEFARREDVPAYAVDMPRKISPLQDLRAVTHMHGLLRRIRPDIVHAHTPKGGLLGMMAASLAGVPVRIYHMRGLPLTTARGSRRALLAATERVSCVLAHRVIAVSHSLRERALEEGLSRPDKIHVLAGGSGNGVDATGRFDPAKLPADTRARVRGELEIPTDAMVIGLVGRLVRDKGIGELAEAWRQLRDSHPTAHLLLVGPFEPRDPVPPQIRQALETDPRVRLVGFVAETPPFYAAMDLLVLPTHREGFPNAPLEAAAMGLPVVTTTATGAIDSVADGVTGTLVPPGDAAALRDAVASYLDSGELRRQHGQAGRQRVLDEFKPERIWHALEDIYMALAAQAGPRAGGTS